MSSTSSMNKNNAAVKRIMQEARELANDPSTDYSAAPLEDDIFEWHCTLRGTPGTEFEGGLYHTRILLPAEYPFRPPSVMVLTPNGRFELNTKICISFTNFHEDLWQPSWGIRTAIVGLQSFFPLKGQAAVGVGGIEYPIPERKRLATLSRDWVCPQCQQSNLELLPDPSPAPSSSETKTTETPANTSPSADDSSTSPSENPVPLVETAVSTLESHPESPELGITEVQLDPSPAGSELSPDSQQTQAELPIQTIPPPINYESSPVSLQAQRQSPARTAPWLLDAAIGVILSLVVALIYRRLF